MGHGSRLAAALLMLLAGCATRGIVTEYPLGEDTMNRLEKGAARLGCTWTREARLAWSVGRREARVRCPDGHEAAVLADSRPNREFDSTLVICRSPAVPEATECRTMIEAIWSAGGE